MYIFTLFEYIINFMHMYAYTYLHYVMHNFFRDDTPDE